MLRHVVLQAARRAAQRHTLPACCILWQYCSTTTAPPPPPPATAYEATSLGALVLKACREHAERPFVYFKPSTLDEACPLRYRLAGGEHMPTTATTIGSLGPLQTYNSPTDASSACGDDWAGLTYSDVHDDLCRVVAYLQAHNILSAQPSTADPVRVAVYCTKSPVWLSAALATFVVGGTLVPIDRNLSPAKAAAAAAALHCAAVLTDAPTALQQALGTHNSALQVLSIANALATEPDMATSKAAGGDHVDTSSVACVALTSGTSTGRPKGVLLSHHNLTSNIASVCHAFQHDPDADRVFSVLPLHHMFELTAGVLAPFAAGVSVVQSPTFNPAQLLGNMQASQPTYIVGVPRLLEVLHQRIDDRLNQLSPRPYRWLVRALLAANAWSDRRLGLNLGRLMFRPLHAQFGGSLKFFVSGGSALAPCEFNFFAAAGLPVLEGYGASETSPIVTMSTPASRRAGSVGRAIDGVQLRIVAAAVDGTNDEPCAQGERVVLGTDEVGELQVRGPNVMLGYDRNAEATAEVLDEGGWYHTGDLGRLDSDGFLYIMGRMGDMVLTANGENVYVASGGVVFRSLPRPNNRCTRSYPDDVQAYFGDHLVTPASPAEAARAVTHSSGSPGSATEVVALGVDVESTCDGAAAGPASKYQQLVLVVVVSGTMSMHAQAALRRRVNILSRQLPSHQRPTSVVIWPNTKPLPKTSTLKVQRRVLAKLLVEEGLVGASPAAAMPAASGAESGAAAASPCSTVDARTSKMLCLVSPVLQQQDGEAGAVVADTMLDGDLGIDSITRVELGAVIEERLGLAVGEAELREAVTAGDVEALLAAATPIMVERSQSPASSSASLPRAADLVAALAQRPSKDEVARLLPVMGRSSAQLGVGAGSRQAAAVAWLRRRVLRAASALLAWWLPVTIEGVDNIPLHEPCILAPNHISHLDVFVARAAYFAALSAANASAQAQDAAQELFVVAAADYFFRGPISSWVSRHVLGMVPMHRPSIADADQDGTHAEKSLRVTLRAAAVCLLSGMPLLAFPEGTRSRDGSLGRFRDGVSLLSAATGAPVVPMGIVGAHNALPPGGHVWIPRRSEVTVRIAAPVPAPRPAAKEGGGAGLIAQLRPHTQEVRAQVAELAQEEH